MDTIISYAGHQLSVSKEVADYFECDRKKMAALKKQDERNLSKSDFELVLSCQAQNLHNLEDTALKNLCLENLRNAVKQLPDRASRFFYFFLVYKTLSTVLYSRGLCASKPGDGCGQRFPAPRQSL